MHKEILSTEQNKLLSLLKIFNEDFFLVGGTAIALHLGHRQSIDFDLFSTKEFDNKDIKNKIKKIANTESVLVDENGEYTAIVDGVKLSFIFYPFTIEPTISLEEIIKTPDLDTLAAMKAYALGRRNKWKDYVDLYFIIKRFNGLDKITDKAKEIFKTEFNEKIFRAQLAYFDDIDFSEEVFYLPGFEIKRKEIQNNLTEASVM